jgi:hypothetical protein
MFFFSDQKLNLIVGDQQILARGLRRDIQRERVREGGRVEVGGLGRFSPLITSSHNDEGNGMNTSSIPTEIAEARAQQVSLTDDALVVDLVDGRTTGV